MIQLFTIFFSSRRRHTRFDCDWSSDVCSSDLVSEKKNAQVSELLIGNSSNKPCFVQAGDVVKGGQQRSEERRVGKECSALWSWFQTLILQYLKLHKRIFKHVCMQILPTQTICR